MIFQKSFVTFGTAIALMTVPSAASAFTITPTGTEPALTTIIGGTAQYGDAMVTRPDRRTGLPPTVYETTLTDANGQSVATNGRGTPIAGGQAAWGNGQSYVFTFEYNPLAKRRDANGVAQLAPQIRFRVKAPSGAIYKGAGPSLAALFDNSTTATPFTDLILGLSADNGQSVSLTDLTLTTYSTSIVRGVPRTITNETLLGSLLNNGTGDTQFYSLNLANNPLYGAAGGRFRLTGTSIFNWTGTPGQNRLAYTVRVGRVIPTPALLPAMIGFAAAALRKKAKQPQDA